MGFKLNTIELNQAIRNLQQLQQLSSGEQKFISDERAEEINEMLKRISSETIIFEQDAQMAKAWFKIDSEK